MGCRESSGPGVANPTPGPIPPPTDTDPPAETRRDTGPTPIPQDEVSVLVTTDDSMGRLLRIDPLTGVGTEVVSYKPSNLVSSVFARDGTLYYSFGAGLGVLDPCTGDRQTVGVFNDAYIPGLASTNKSNLYGIDTWGERLVRIDRQTAEVTSVGALGRSVGNTGLTWDDAREGFLAIDGDTDELFEIDPVTGATETLASLDYDFGPVGIELDEGSNTLYACGGPDLVVVNPSTGHVTVVGPIGTLACNDIAAAWFPSPCLLGPGLIR